MAASLGSTSASFRLGEATPAKLAIGAVDIWAATQTLYFLGTIDTDWAELGNWWEDAEGTVAASSLPTAADSVIATGLFIGTNSGSTPTVANFTLNDPNSDEATLGIAIIVTGVATFNDSSRIEVGSVTGVATFNDSAVNHATVSGTATFNDSAWNGPTATVTGNAIFNDTSQNHGAVTGTATFNDDACNAGGTAGTFVPDPPPACE